MALLRIGCLLLCSTRLSIGAVLRHRDSKPSNPYDGNTTPYCTWWHDYNEVVSCSQLLNENKITLEQLRRWNPTITSTCEGFEVGRSYCVKATYEPKPTTTPTTTPTLTNRSNGIETPQPTQPNIASNCDKFYFVKSGDSCDSISTAHGITTAQFAEWNPNSGMNCAGLWAEAYACVSIVGHETSTPTPVNPQPTTAQPTTAQPSNVIATPQPTQPEMVNNCDKFHLVKPGESCPSIASANGITLAEFLAWNPKAGSNCNGLWADTYACVSITGHEPTPTNPSNGIQTPFPAQPNIVTNCNKFYFVNSGDTCPSIVSANSITLAKFLEWNPKAGSNCNGLWANAYACVSVIGYTPTPTDPGNGVQTPAPIQAGMVANCKKFHYVATGQNCPDIQTKYGVTLANLYKWNPAIGPDCRGMWAEAYICVGV